jgi:hypothetical protein
MLQPAPTGSCFIFLPQNPPHLFKMTSVAGFARSGKFMARVWIALLELESISSPSYFHWRRLFTTARLDLGELSRAAAGLAQFFSAQEMHYG